MSLTPIDIQDAQAANKPELAHLWNAIMQDAFVHLAFLKQELAKGVQEVRLLQKHTHALPIFFFENKT